MYLLYNPTNNSIEMDDPPRKFLKIVMDMTDDLIITFPEHSDKLFKWTKDGFNQTINEEELDQKLNNLYNYSLKIYPERFFDIIYQNEHIFADNDVNTCFLPGFDFEQLFNSSGISDKTRKTMWNYLKLLLLTIVSSVKDKSTFGDTNTLFNDIDEDKLLTTLTETMASMSDFFENNNIDETINTKESVNDDFPNENETEEFTRQNGTNERTPFDIPNVGDVFGHLKGLFDGKIGNLVKELAEEISENLADVLGKDDMNDVRSTKDVLEKLMKNPKKVTDLFKTINDKVQDKLQSGEITQEELLKEITELMAKMKGGNENFDFQEILKCMGGGGNIAEMMNKMKSLFKPNKKNAKKEGVDDSKMTLHEKMKNRILIKKMQQAELKLQEEQRIIEASKNFVPYNEHELSFTVDGDEGQIKSDAPKKKKKRSKNKK